jgi:hypothetical protein
VVYNMSEGNDESYEPPELTEVGSVTDVTGADKLSGGDGGGLQPAGG